MLIAVLIIGCAILSFQLGALRLLLKEQIKQQAVMIALLDTISPADTETIAVKARAEWQAIAGEFAD